MIAPKSRAQVIALAVKLGAIVDEASGDGFWDVTLSAADPTHIMRASGCHAAVTATEICFEPQPADKRIFWGLVWDDLQAGIEPCDGCESCPE